MSRRLHLTLLLAVALALRLLVWHTLPYVDMISDEGEYWGAAAWLAQGRGFAFFDQWIWSRPPTYLLFLAAHIKLLGPTALWAPRLTQALLGVALVYLVVLLGRRLAPPEHAWRAGLLAGWMLALSYAFATFAYLLLSETLFLLLLLSALLALLRWREARRPRAAAGWLATAGLLLGLAALTKAIILTWLPCVFVWVCWTRSARMKHEAGSMKHEAEIDQIDTSFPLPATAEQHAAPGTRQAGSPRTPPATRFQIPNSKFRLLAAGLASGLLLTLAVCLVVLPWSAYATARWGYGAGIILSDTTGGYNFALGAQTGHKGWRDENELHDLLCGGAQCDGRQAERQAAAYALGWRWIQEKPGAFLRKSALELLDMVQIRYGGAERLSSGYTQGSVPLAHLLALFADDTLYVLALLLGVLGLLRSQDRPGKGLVLSWLLYNVLVGALIFAVNRFRMPLLPFLYIYAACAIAQWRAPWQAAWRRRWGWGLAGLLALLVLPTYLYWPPQLDETRRSALQDTLKGLDGLAYQAECRAIEQVLERGEVALARSMHDAAHQAQERYCLALLNARLLEAEGKIEGPAGALAFLAVSAPSNNPVQAAKVLMLEGALYRRLGRLDEARDRFVTRAVESVNDQLWAWENLRPEPTMEIDVGSTLDYGYIKGFSNADYRGSPDFRWSEDSAMIRFPGAGTGQPQTLLLRVNGYTQNPQPTTLTIRGPGGAVERVTLSSGWQELRVPLGATPPGEEVQVSFESSVFVVGPADLAERVRSRNRRPLRMVGFQLDWARLQ